MLMLMLIMLVRMLVVRLVQVFVRIVKMHVPLPDQLAKEIINAKEKERASGDAREPGSDAVANDRPEQGDRQTEHSRDQNMAGAGQRGDGNRLGRIPFLHASRQNKRQPMRRYCRVEKGDAETGGGNGRKNSLIHESGGTKADSEWKLTIPARDGEDLSG
jgi:hypothetical protein